MFDIVVVWGWGGTGAGETARRKGLLDEKVICADAGEGARWPVRSRKRRQHWNMFEWLINLMLRRQPVAQRARVETAMKQIIIIIYMGRNAYLPLWLVLATWCALLSLL